MPFLQILKGPNEGAVVPLEGDRFVLGRNPDCGIVIPVTSVSREHAQILRVAGKYFIEDKQSRNGTFVNSQRINARTPLKNNDRIRICDFMAAFVEQTLPRFPQDDEGPLTEHSDIGGSVVVTRTAVRVRAVQPLAVAGGVNTPDYLSARQIDEPPGGAVKEAGDDLHAVAVMAFQMLVGRLPFPTEPLIARLEAIVERRFDSAQEACRLLGIDSPLAPLIDRALSGGYSSANQWLAALDRLTGRASSRGPVAAVGPQRGERFTIGRLLFEDVLSEAYEVRGEKSMTRFTLRLFKPGFHSPAFLALLRELPATGHDHSPTSSPGILRRFLAGRARPLPVRAGAVVEVDGNLDSSGCPCLVEEFAGNQTLMDLIRSGELQGNSKRIGGLLCQILDALAYAHEMGAVHGNVTPYCIFVTDQDHVKVEGFGLHTELEQIRMELGGASHTSHVLLEAQPVEQLRALLDITTSLFASLDAEELFKKIPDSLFGLFRQADRCFLIQAGEGDRLMPRVIKTRRAADEGTARFSRSIVRRCLESAQAFLSDDASPDDTRLRSVMCAPLMATDGKAFGVIQVDTQDRSKKFTQEDLKLLCGVGNQASIALENARLLDETIRQEHLKRDLEFARKLQMSFLPNAPPSVEGYEFFGFCEVARAVGGNYHDFIPLPGGRIAAAIGDVAGKGIVAALLVARLAGDLRFSLLFESDPAAALARLNDLFCPVTSAIDRFATLAVVVIDPCTHVATALSAGHPFPLLYRAATGEVANALPDDRGGLPLGIVEGTNFDAWRITLEAGDRIVLFTDGVERSLNVRGEEFGREGISRTLVEAGHLSPALLVSRLAAAVKTHALGRELPEDVTLVAVGQVGPSPPSLPRPSEETS
jgi:serine phosphatase RsbU (regulator of sigma subunit)